MLAVRANERSAAAAGINVVRSQAASASRIGSFIAGLGGSLLAYKQTQRHASSRSAPSAASALFATAYLAGITSVSGGILAGVLGVGGHRVRRSSTGRSTSATWYAIVTGVC